ncbi:MAG: class I SAM-dependent rRNA methyltransferase [Pseudomonadota bacterium]
MTASSFAPHSRPVVKLRPGKGKRLAHGAPWAYADEIALERRTKSLAPGSLVTLVEGERSFGTAAFNPKSQIAARLLDPDPTAEIDESWLAHRLTRALDLRQRLYDAPFYRLVHAEGDGLPGLVIDRFGETLVIQPNAAWIDRLAGPLIEAARTVTGCSTIVINATSRVRPLEGLETHLTLAAGEVPGPIPVPMNGATYLADVMGGQKTGLFYDQRPNHAFAAQLGRGGRVLDLFSHVGGFALAALAAGAEHALAVDSSAPALALATDGARQSGVEARFETRRQDAFAGLETLSSEGARFDLIISDPPAFAPAKSALPQGLRAYERLARQAAPLVSPGGWLVLCSCSHAADPAAFHKASTAGIAKAGRQGQLIWSGRAGPDHPQHPALPETSYLKALAFRLDG